MDTASLFTIAYGISLFISVVCLVIILIHNPSRYQKNLTTVFVFTVVTLLGYWFRITATDVGTLIIAKKLILLGGSYMGFALLLVIADFCNVNISRKIQAALASLCSVVAFIAFTFDSHHLFYKSYRTEIFDGFRHIVTETGPFYHLYSVISITLIISCIAIATYSIVRNTNRRKIISFILMFFSLCPTLVHIFETANNTPFSLIPVVSILSMVGIMVLVFVFHIVDMQNILYEVAFNKINVALVGLSSDGRFIGANPLALQIFPNLADVTIGSVVDKQKNEDLMELFDERKSRIPLKSQTFESQFLFVDDGHNKQMKILCLNDITETLEMRKLSHTNVKSKASKILDMQHNLVINMADLIEGSDDNTGGHVKRTSEIIKLLISEMAKDKDRYPSLTENVCKDIVRLAPLHDIGKITVSDLILNKPGKFTDEEFEIMKSHAANGKKMVDVVCRGVEDHPDVLKLGENIAQYHHEKWNGTGYPSKLSGENIPLEARIMAIADVYDALVSKRVYKPPMPFETANKIMLESFGSHFDPALQKYYEICRPQMEAYYAKDR